MFVPSMLLAVSLANTVLCFFLGKLGRGCPKEELQDGAKHSSCTRQQLEPRPLTHYKEGSHPRTCGRWSMSQLPLTFLGVSGAMDPANTQGIFTHAQEKQILPGNPICFHLSHPQHWCLRAGTTAGLARGKRWLWVPPESVCGAKTQLQTALGSGWSCHPATSGCFPPAGTFGPWQ